MDKETREYLEPKLLILAQKDDVEKLRQETKANFRQVKEENKTQILEWKEEIKGAIEQSRKERIAEADSLREELKTRLQKFEEETKTALDQAGKETLFHLQLLGEGGKAHIASSLNSSREGTKADMDRLREGIGGLTEKTSKMTEEIGGLSEKIKEGFAEIKQELGSMIRFSHADLEKKLNALEARVKALEKMVLP
jgi:hypothetical protein